VRLFLLFIFSLSIFSCQGKPLRLFDKVKPGMEKADVIEIMETPWATTRLHGKDRWIYVFYEDGVRYEKEVHFLNGAAVYVGDTWKPVPEKVAETVDKKKDEDEVKFAEESKKAKEENKNAFSNYEKNVKGEGKKVKYLPEFTEVQ
jgi:outer membrane protein assembly factor BamE